MTDCCLIGQPRARNNLDCPIEAKISETGPGGRRKERKTMRNRRKTEQVKEDLRKYIKENSALLEAWKKVRKRTKKDGTDFQNLRQAFKDNENHVDVVRKTYATQDFEKALRVWCRVDGKYIDDEIDVYDPRTENYHESRAVRAGYYTIVLLTADEVMQRVNERINLMEKRIAESEAQLELVDEVYEAFADTIDKALEEAAQKAGGQNHLYYACREYMRTAY